MAKAKTAVVRTRNININLRVTEKEAKAFKKAAKASGTNLSIWMRQLCRKESGMKTG